MVFEQPLGWATNMRCTTTWPSTCCIMAWHEILGANMSQSFIEDIDRLWGEDYVPDDQDLLRSRLRTTGITETIFDLGQLTYRMFDVGGQRSERKKWIHCFENVNCLLFLVAISGYDQCLVEDKDGVGNKWHQTGSYEYPANSGTEPNEWGAHALGVDCQLPLVCQISADPLPE